MVSSLLNPLICSSHYANFTPIPTSYSANTTVKYNFELAVVSVTIRVLMATFGSGFFGTGKLIIFQIQSGQTSWSAAELLPMLLLGVVGGLLGAGLNAAVVSLAEWRRRVLPALARRLGCGKERARFYEGLAICLFTSTVSFLVPLMSACQVRRCRGVDREGVFQLLLGRENVFSLLCVA